MQSAVIFLSLLAGISAWPQLQSIQSGFQPKIDEANVQTDRAIIANVIKDVVAGVSQSIVDAGLDPLILEEHDVVHGLPVPSIFSYRFRAESVVFKGLSDIKVNKVNYASLSNKLTFDISLPSISLAIEEALLEATIFSSDLNVKFGGRLVIGEIRIKGEMRINLGVLSGVSIRNLQMNFTFGGITSDLELVVQGHDISESVNDWLGNRVPTAIQSHEKEINKLIEHYMWEIINEVL